MYDEASGIRVYIKPRISKGEPGYDEKRPGGVQEYQPTEDSPLWSDDSRERYIEAITDHQFDIHVSLDPEFSFKGQSCINIVCQIDDSAAHNGAILFEKTSTPVDSIPIPHATTPVWTFGDYSTSGDPPAKYRLGHWKASGFVMGEHWPIDDPELSFDEEDTDSGNVGKIQIMLQRSNRWTYKLSARTAAANSDPTKKYKAILVDRRSGTEASAVKEGLRVGGDAGEVITFTFNYASKKFLEANDILPATSDTESEDEAACTGDAATPVDEKQDFVDGTSTQTEYVDNEDAPASKKVKLGTDHANLFAMSSSGSSSTADQTTQEPKTNTKLQRSAQADGKNSTNSGGQLEGLKKIVKAQERVKIMIGLKQLAEQVAALAEYD